MTDLKGVAALLERIAVAIERQTELQERMLEVKRAGDRAFEQLLSADLADVFGVPPRPRN